MAKRFLLVTEEWAGSGHRMAAEALHEVLDSHEGIELSRIVGGLTTASPALRELSRFFYLSMLRYGRPMWQRIYEQDRLFGTILKAPLGWWLSRRLENTLLQKESPDVVIATHAYCLSALAQSKQRMAKPFHLVSIPTDYHLNRFWVHPQIDTYIVAHQHLADRLILSYQVQASKIQVLGIPVRQAFSTAAKVDKRFWKKQLGLEEQFTVLVCGGEGGYGRIAEVMKALAKEMESLQLIVITGKNEKLYEELQGFIGKYLSPHRILLKKFEAQMWQWIGAADVYITKPGGISCAEALALRTPLLLYQPLPGQERENSLFLLDQKAAVLANDTEEIRTWIRHWRNQKQRDKIIEQMEQVRRPESAREIAEYLLHV